MFDSVEPVRKTNFAENKSSIVAKHNVLGADNHLPLEVGDENAPLAFLSNANSCELTEIVAHQKKRQNDSIEFIEADEEEPFGTLAEPFKCDRLDTQYGTKLLSFEISEVRPRPSQ